MAIYCSDKDLVQDVTELEKYSPIVENITMDDEELCQAVEQCNSMPLGAVLGLLCVK